MSNISIQLTDSILLKPAELIITDLKWKFLVRSILRNKNIMMTGPSGCGKTIAAQHVAKALDRPFFFFNCGSTQDPRTTLIGNTQFDKDKGTFHNASLFIQAIQTPNAVILMDELTRAHPEAWNILMTAFDYSQRYIRVDEAINTPTINVHPTVTFIATANIGVEYTATRQLDRAILDRFTIIEMDTLNKQQEINLIKIKYPELNNEIIAAIADISSTTREELVSDNPKLTTALSTRVALEYAGLIVDGFTLTEAAEIAIYPFFSNDGGTESERTFIKQIIQKYSTINSVENNAPLF